MQPITFDEVYGGRAAKLSSRYGTAVVAAKGAQILSWVPAHSTEVFWLSPDVDLARERPTRGGVPVCWPWFGAHPGIKGSPSHGFARTAEWSTVEHGDDGSGPYLKLGLDVGSETRPDWPHTARVELTVRLGSRLAVELATTNTGRERFDISEALHSYFRVGDIAKIAVFGLENRKFIDQLDDSRFGSEAGPISISGEIDRIYQDTADTIVLDDASLRRRITIVKFGSLSTVVWNPWIEKSARLGDMGQDGYGQMVCIETANAGANAVTIAPGERHQLQVEICVEAI